MRQKRSPDSLAVFKGYTYGKEKGGETREETGKGGDRGKRGRGEEGGTGGVAGGKGVKEGRQGEDGKSRPHGHF